MSSSSAQPVFIQAATTSLTLRSRQVGCPSSYRWRSFERGMPSRPDDGSRKASPFSPPCLEHPHRWYCWFHPSFSPPGGSWRFRPFADPTRFAALLIILINALMALPFVIRVVDPAYVIHRQRTQRLAASLGLGGISRLRLVDWPGLRKPLLTALSFCNGPVSRRSRSSRSFRSGQSRHPALAWSTAGSVAIVPMTPTGLP